MGFDINGISLTSGGSTLAMNNGGTAWMALDSNGILSRPQTPYFRGQLTGFSGLYNASGGNLLVTADENVGSCWNNSTGVFTCPVAGYYYANMAGIVSGAAQGVQATGYLQIVKNAGTYHFTHWNHVGGWTYVSLAGIVQAAAGDAISYSLFSFGTGGLYGAGGHGCYSIGLLA